MFFRNNLMDKKLAGFQNLLGLTALKIKLLD